MKSEREKATKNTAVAVLFAWRKMETLVALRSKAPFLLSLLSYLLSGNDKFREDRKTKREKLKEQKETTTYQSINCHFFLAEKGRLELPRRLPDLHP